ncbi:MAG: hydroxysqualene dehydroxylase HpnE [Rhodospirillales bacterium]|nr:hydroxysqualene dehydroxylase HpnE [Rhodospirillales bacterium]MDP7098071.1 hydroxysqualene dehydroxylase HpnE [Rhodospirillales bacterium]MDP7215006.1 hydroxysqualene dehydroxylase HpnE [Rhodospirillales bacterium]HIJ92652.1 NAD(P)-binding protein [Rhodospirillaceae bacterium]HJP54737.1 hydroxysqualene dehydroxylase HpnE [Rhodospirillales bacterium]
MAPTTHIVGAGLAGLSCAVGLALAGWRMVVYEAATQAGGRCRSFHDPVLDRLIDNGSHILLSGNSSAFAYLEDIGAGGSLTGPDRAAFPFFDLQSNHRWTVRPGSILAPWWLFPGGVRRVPGARVFDCPRGLRLAWAGKDTTVAECLAGSGALYRRFWEPLAVSVLNTSAEEASAALFRSVLRETLGRGEAACRLRIARTGLSESFIAPALAFLERRGCPVRLNQRLRSLVFDNSRVSGLDFGAGKVNLATGDAVVLTVPPAAAEGLVPGLAVPRASRAIVNGHFRLQRRYDKMVHLGLVGGIGQWLFVRGDIASVSVSAADDLAKSPVNTIAAGLWDEIARALGLGGAPLPAYRIVKEKRATFAQIPAEVSRRPGVGTPWSNLFLAGDWTDTGLPATIEGAVRSGHGAAAAVRSLM